MRLPEVAEEDVRLYPLRGDSLSWFSVKYDRWAQGRRGGPFPSSVLDPDTAAALVAERIGVPPVRAAAREVSPTDADRAAMHRVWPAAGMRGLNRFYAQYYDADEPPFLCSFARLDVTADALRLRCFAATGRRQDEHDPPVEDDVLIPLGPV